MRTDEELKKIAEDLRSGRIFTDRHIPQGMSLQGTFMVLAFADEAMIKRLKEDDIGMFFEYLDQAGPMAVNGCPTFFSCKTATKAEVTKIAAYYKAIQDAVDSVKV